MGMCPNESGRDKAREIKNDRLRVNPKSPLWLRSLSCESCSFATLNAFLYPRKPPVAQQVSGLARTLTALLTKRALKMARACSRARQPVCSAALA